MSMSNQLALVSVALVALSLTPCVAGVEVVQARKHKHQTRKDVKEESEALKESKEDAQTTKDTNEDNSNAVVDQEAIVPVAPPIEHNLRVCNGYAAKQPLVVVEDSSSVTKDPIDYKKCADLTMQLKEDDELFFKVGDEQVGAFTASGLPESKSPLLLVVYRRGQNLKSAAFESHIYADSPLAQMAIIDTYSGDTDNGVQIRRGWKGKLEPLSFGSIAFINPGDYDISLTGEGGSQPGGPAAMFSNGIMRSMNVTIKPATSYVAMRVGLEGNHDFPEELVMLGGAATVSLSAVVFLATSILASLLRHP